MMGIPCWDCGNETRPVTRPGGVPWWACQCGRLIPAGDLRVWIGAAQLQAVEHHRFPWEPAAPPPTPVDNWVN